MATPSSRSWSRRTDAPQLLHPVWWAALGLLVVNDHALKHLGLLPGWVTGKLSDVAGMVVAPVLLAAALRTRTVAARAAAFAWVAAVFTVMKVFPAGARAAESLAALAGVDWRVVADPTDVLALLALPVAWWLCDRPAPRRERAVHALGVALSAGACVATSQPTPTDPTLPWSTAVFVANRTSRQIDVRVRWINGDLACALVRAHASDALSHATFSGERVTVHLALDRTVPLDRDNAALVAGGGGGFPGDPPGDGGFNRTGCEAALVQADGLPETVVFWTRTTRGSVPGRLRTTEHPDGAVDLVDGATAGTLALHTVDPEVQVFALDPAGPICNAPTAQYYGWSEGFYARSVQLETVRALADGCTRVSFRGEPAAMSVCVPREAFPFAAGDTLDLSTRTRDDGGAELHLRDARRELTVFRDVGITANAVLGEVGVALVETAGCVGRRLDCGGFVVPRALQVQGRAEPLLPGQRVTLARPSHTVNLFLGRVESVAVSQPECVATAESPGTRVDLVSLTEEVSP